MVLTKTALIHPVVDFFMIGGLSILLIPLLLMANLQDHLSADEFRTGLVVIYFLVDMPHFAAGFQLFYGDHRKRIWRSRTWILAGVIAPLLMIIFMGVNYSLFHFQNIGLLITVMFLFGGWHYTKQVFGAIIVTASRHLYYLNPRQRFWLKLNMAALWMSALTMIYRQSNPHIYYTLKYPFVVWQGAFALIPYALVLISLGIFLTETFRRYRKESVLPPLISWVPLAALYMWYLPLSGHNSYILVVLPLFHALQYLLFVYAYKRNENRTAAEPKTEAVPTSQGPMRKTFIFFITALVIGALFVDFIPRALDHFVSSKFSEVAIFLVMFNLFINIQHFLLDFLMWRRNIPEFQKYLMDSERA